MRNALQFSRASHLCCQVCVSPRGPRLYTDGAEGHGYGGHGLCGLCCSTHGGRRCAWGPADHALGCELGQLGRQGGCAHAAHRGGPRALGVGRLEFLGREVALKKKEEEKEEKKDTDATMAGTAAAPAAARPRRRGGRARKAAPPPVAADLALTAGSPLLADAARAAPPSRTLQQQCSRERSPRRELSPNATSTASVSSEGLVQIQDLVVSRWGRRSLSVG